ncbi:amino acid/amide ABC transporter ATP-binding protein 2, HAAT family (TC 3.A.1.4.-) [Modestobacter sp. DSM 44400]|uniref:ABC transporter ATP-binding protein n=1 Tax=Modestobacter sp. DSM 44400 TaxID=1550230 RepID=UPI00089B305C|nr:ABC transporter ATP-binding protein [Modestobacter sp. DSM 44400]SDX99819.1 amino acid/amide ABC transporter ATP-binding protein 2, HAAT family (TC 3.A.1.4.-) [Modestobacter sp. DSM 44400]
MLRIENLRAAYGDAIALHDVSMTVQAGEITGILGPNGAGKSTLLKSIAGHLRPSGGAIYLDDEPIHRLAPYDVAERGIALVPEGRRVFSSLSVQDNLLVGGSAKRARSQRRRQLDEVYALFPRLQERRLQDAGTLSGGEQQMVAIGRALMLQPRLILLDEPSLGLAPLVTALVFETIRQIGDTGVTMLLVEQNASQALTSAARGYVLEQGRVVFSGDQHELRGSPAVRDAYLGVTSD